MIITKLVTAVCNSCRGNGYNAIDKKCKSCYGEGKVIEWRK